MKTRAGGQVCWTHRRTGWNKGGFCPGRFSPKRGGGGEEGGGDPGVWSGGFVHSSIAIEIHPSIITSASKRV